MESVMDAADDDVMGVADVESFPDPCTFELDPDELEQLEARARVEGHERQVTTIVFYCDLCETELRDEVRAGLEPEYNDPKFRVRVLVDVLEIDEGMQRLISASLAPGSETYEGWRACSGSCNADICGDCFENLRAEAEAAGTSVPTCPICHGPISQHLCADRTRDIVEGRRDPIGVIPE